MTAMTENDDGADIVVRSLATMDEYIAVEEIQRTTWSMTDLEIIPAHALHATQHSGAALLGAFDGDRLVGFTYGILATQDIPGRLDEVAAARLKMYSVIAGVLPGVFGYHPDFAQIDWSKVEWLKSGQPWTPDVEKSLADNGLKHKDVIRFRTPGLTGIKGSFS